jgi:hypothetical protein
MTTYGDIFKTVGYDCCCSKSSGHDTLGEYSTCSQRSGIFTPREQDVLSRIRDASLKAREVKGRLRAFDDRGDPEARKVVLSELEALRRLRVGLEEERIDAANERMRILGHL